MVLSLGRLAQKLNLIVLCRYTLKVQIIKKKKKKNFYLKWKKARLLVQKKSNQNNILHSRLQDTPKHISRCYGKRRYWTSINLCTDVRYNSKTRLRYVRGTTFCTN